MSATPPSPANPAPARPGPTKAVAPPWTVADLVARFEAGGVAARAGADDGDGRAGYGPQIDFVERPAAEGTGETPAVEGLTPLVEFGLIRLVGRDAAQFLQGQLTNDIALAGTGHAIHAGLCNPKGRLIATFLLWRGSVQADEEGDAFWLACSRDLAPQLARRLQMFVLRAKVRIASHDHDRVVLGLVGARALARAGDVLVEHDAPQSRTVVDLPEAGKGQGEGRIEGGAEAKAGSAPPASTGTTALPSRALVVATLDELPVLARRASAGGLRWLDTRQWRWHEVQAGVARITAATTEHFVPQMINFDHLGVSFTKGCYPGQEVVARSHYRGTTKRRTYLLAGGGDLPMPADDLDAATGQTEPAGEVVLAARDPVEPARWALLAEARIEAAEAGLGWQGQALEARALPYPLVEAPTLGRPGEAGAAGSPT